MGNWQKKTFELKSWLWLSLHNSGVLVDSAMKGPDPFRKEGLIPPAAGRDARLGPQLLAWREEKLNTLSRVTVPSRGSWHPITDQHVGVKTGPTWDNWRVILLPQLPVELANVFVGVASLPNFSLGALTKNLLREYVITIKLLCPRISSITLLQFPSHFNSLIC